MAKSSPAFFPNRDWIVPEWPAAAHVRAVFTTRAGGVSNGPWAGLNLGDHVGDDPICVAENRRRLQAMLGVRPVFLNQVHGTDVLLHDGSTPDGALADACVAAQSGVACTVMVADCLPVLFSDRQGTVVAAAHAGWRGLAAGVLEATLQRVFEQKQAIARAQSSSGAINIEVSKCSANLLVWLGPCIGPASFEVGGEVRAAFADGDPKADQHFVASAASGKFRADLAGLARQRLMAVGLSHIYGNDSSPKWCSVSDASRFFSHRRDSVALGGSGRMAACVWLGLADLAQGD